MNGKVLEDNTELLRTLSVFQLKSKSSLKEMKDLDLLVTPAQETEAASVLNTYGARCFLRDKWGSKYIIPLARWPYFRIIHLNLNRRRRSNKVVGFLPSLLSYWKGSVAITFLGVDGSGKTTLTDEVAAALEPFFRVHSEYFGWNKFAFPFLGAWRRLSKKHKCKVRCEKVSWLHLSVYYVELLVRYGLRVLPRRLLGRVVLLDRYFYDKLIWLEDSSWRFRFFSRITPRVNFAILLVSPPQMIRSRKEELSITEIDRLQKMYLAKRDKLGFRVICNDGDINNVLERVIKCVQPALINKKRALR